MTIRLSTPARNLMAQGLGFGSIFNRGFIEIYSGAQPATADAAVTGTLLGRASLSSGAITREVLATGTMTVTGGSVSVLTITVGGLNIIPDGAVPYNTSTAQTASDMCDAINRNGLFQATVTGSAVTIIARPGSGASYNAAAVSSTGSVTASYGAFSGGVAPVNGLVWSQPAAGVISKPSAAVWSFAGLAAGTAGWFRFVGSVSDGGALQTAVPWFARMDGSIGTSGADLNLANITIAVSTPVTIDSFSITLPAQ